MVEGFRQFKEPVSISVVDSTPSDEDYLTKGLSNQKIKAFTAAWKMGYYKNPREITPQEIAASIGISRVTLSGHLRNVESHLAALLANEFDL
jgi:predicted DNA binding protein